MRICLCCTHCITQWIRLDKDTCYSCIQDQGTVAFSVESYHRSLKKKTRVVKAEEKKRARERRGFIRTCAKAILAKKEDNIIFLSH